jgi:hypothetical protein
MSRRIMRQRTNGSNDAHVKQGFAIVENLLYCCRLVGARRERPRGPTPSLCFCYGRDQPSFSS